ncbi:MAG: hypothetical protein WDO14_13905 [Bacteroidota bacterium]
MKKSLFGVVLLGLILVIDSCKKDDPAPPAIAGTWTLNTYKMTELPTGFTKYEGYEDVQILGIEVGYTFLFNQDGSYTRAFKVGGGYPSINDKGKWTLEGTTLKVAPDDADDLDKIDAYGTPGLEFTVVGDITAIRMTLSRSVTVYILPDSFDTTQTPTNDDFKPVDITLQYIFDKL